MKAIVLTTLTVAQSVAAEETKRYAVMKGHYNKIPPLPSNMYQVPLLQSNAQLPVSVDWSEEGNVVQPPPDQGQCGSCWSFGSAGAIESAFAIANNEAAPKVSEEELLDCIDYSKAGFPADHVGCDGANAVMGYMYYNQKNACSEKSYPYDSGAWNKITREPVFQCRQKDHCDVKIEGREVAGFVGEIGNVKDLKTAVALQPIAISIFASETLQLYTKGVLSANEVDCFHNETDHIVLLVGYGQQDGVEYWKIRNSWGMAWGESGYFRAEIRDDVNGSLCMNTASDTNSYPVLSAGPSPPHPSCNAAQPSSGQRMIWMEDANGHSTCQHHCKADGIHEHCAWCVYDINKCRRVYGDECDQGHVCPDNTMIV